MRLNVCVIEVYWHSVVFLIHFLVHTYSLARAHVFLCPHLFHTQYFSFLMPSHRLSPRALSLPCMSLCSLALPDTLCFIVSSMKLFVLPCWLFLTVTTLLKPAPFLTPLLSVSCPSLHLFHALTLSHNHAPFLATLFSLSHPHFTACAFTFSHHISLLHTLLTFSSLPLPISLSHLPLPFPLLSLMQSSTPFFTDFSHDITHFLATLCSFLQPHALFLQPHVQSVSQPYVYFHAHFFSHHLSLSTHCYFLCIHTLFLVHSFPFLACSCSLISCASFLAHAHAFSCSLS